MPREGLRRLSSREVVVRLFIVTLLFAAYWLTFHWGFPVYGRVVGAVSVVPIAAAAIAFGIPGGTIASVSVIPTIAISLTILNVTPLFPATSISILGFTVLFGVGAGIIRDVALRERRSRALLDLAYEAAEDGLWDYRPDTGEVYFNPRWFTMLGYEPNAFPHSFDSWVAIMHPDDRDRVIKQLNRVMHDGSTQFSYSFRLRTRQDTWTWILSRGKVVERDTDGTAARLVGVHSDISDLKRAETELVRLANHDQLTGFLNRQSYFDLLDQLIRQASRMDHEPVIGALVVDLDHFKDVNDSFGHDTGDELIRLSAHRLKKHIRTTDHIFRLGGDEFAIILNHLQSPTDAALVASNLIRAFTDPFEIHGDVIYIGLSIGIATFPRDGQSANDLIQNSDAALYRSKRDRNTYSFYTLEMQSAAVKKMAMIHALRMAIEEDQFDLHYQPVVTRDGTIVGSEALLRWNDPDGGVWLPPEFISVAEDTGLIIRLGRWVLARACSQNAQWAATGLPGLRISVNISPKQLRHSSIVDDIELALAATDLPPEQLSLELTESSFLSPKDEGATRLREFQKRGLSISLDDFGTGYSSMSYLKQLPVNVLKIDRAFVIGLPDDAGDSAIVRATITMAHGLGLKVIAEGVDSEEQVDFLANLGCDFFQGYYFHKPLPAKTFESIVSEQRATVLSPE